ncbi:hypothetical protein V5O48_012665 [Marasmius crinis-equi]|uniref:Carboxylesterase type B domain-containing protein n=1 Tax=Marasmius crinis-equi TaxID=585013 RepID=A0ABR3F285_9AGAR
MSRARAFFVNLLLFTAFSLHGVTSLEQPPDVTLGRTRLTGARNAELNVEFFGGIPFAESPLGDLRFRQPVLKSALNTSEFDASKPGLACLQAALPADAVTEDCLTLNIFRPAAATGSTEKLPVLFWIYGGGWISGSAARYNGSRLVSRSVARGTPVLVVTVNYRTGPLGFPLGEEAAGDNVLNLGLRDNLVALEWVQANIEAFGGDPSKVTMFGESAGAGEIDLLLFNDQINDLASGAILESDPGIALMVPSLTNEVWSGFVGAVSACSHLSNTKNTLECLRSESVSSGDLLQAFELANVTFSGPSAVWGPVLDGKGGVIPDYPSRSTVKADFPVIIGNCLDEGTIFEYQSTINTSSDDAVRELVKLLSQRPPGENEAIQRITEHILEAYPNVPSLGSPFDTGNDTFGLDPSYKRVSAVLGDSLFQSHRRFLLEQLAQRPQTQVYSFIFADSNEGVITVPREFILGSPPPGSLGVTHSAEIFYVFGTLEDELGAETVARSTSELSQAMMDYWISFAVTGDPNDGRGAQRPSWKPFSSDNRVIIQLKGNDTRMIPDTFREKTISVFNEDPIAFRR